jgi:cell division protein FtsW
MSEHGDPAYYLKSQIFATVVGVGVMIFLNIVDYHVWEKFATLGYVVANVLILLVLSPRGITKNGATRWIDVFGISLQPAEVAKIAIILLNAVLICKIGRGITRVKSYAILMGIALVPASLIFFVTSNLSSALIVMGITALMCFVADPKYKKHLVVFGALIVLAVAGIALILVLTGGETGSGDYRFDRVLAWLDPEAFASDDGFQILQALYAIGSGGIWGKGLGQSMQKLGFLPEAQNDMVFSIICEELGLFGAFCVLLLFIMLIWRFMFIANNAPDLFGALLVVGVMAHFAIQVILNIAVVTNSIPNTGITLPFISYGGSSVVFLLAEIGLVLNVASQIQIQD